MSSQIATIMALLIPVITEIGVQWKAIPLSRENAPIAVVVLSLLLSCVYVFSGGHFSLDVATVDAVLGFTTVTTALAAFLYEYVYKLVIVRGLGAILAYLKK
jgi:hypothetical protein